MAASIARQSWTGFRCAVRSPAWRAISASRAPSRSRRVPSQPAQRERALALYGAARR